MTKLTDDFLRSFSLPQVALLHTLALEMETYGLAASEVIDLCVERLELGRVEKEAPRPASSPQRRKRRPRLSSVPCPECGEYVEITPVNVSKCTAIGGPWKSSLICGNSKCRWTQLSEKSTKEFDNGL